MMESSQLHPNVVHFDPTQNPTRRSISIFSRRGTDTPEQAITPLSQSITMSATKNNSRRPGAWKLRLSRLNKGHDQVSSTSTTPPMTPLEQAMATSPNEEILSAIGKHNLSNTSATPYLPPSDQWNQSQRDHHYPPSIPCTGDSKVGVWRDGVAHWDPNPKQSFFNDVMTTWNSGSLASSSLESNGRPDLSVVIPATEQRSPIGMQSVSKRYSLPVVTSSGLCMNISSSPVSYTHNENAIHPAFRTNKDFLENRSSNESARGHVRESSTGSLNASRSSTTSSTIPEEASDKASVYSSNSSMTSVEEETELFNTPDWSPSNIPKRSGSNFSITSPVDAGVFDDQLNIIGSPPSPTLSDVFQELHTQLGTISEDSPASESGKDVAETPQYTPLPAKDLTRAPTIPKKSRKREWRAKSMAAGTSSHMLPQPADPLTRRLSVPSRAGSLQQLDSRLWPRDARRSNSVRSIRSTNEDVPESEMSLGSAQISLLLDAITSLGPATEVKSVPTTSSPESSSPFAAQAVLLRIMSCLDSIEDLQAISTINKGMRKIYKANELTLLRKVLKNKSPAAWELREWSPVPFTDFELGATSPSCEHSPATYMYGLRQDERILRKLKLLILERCQSFLRNETVAALLSEEDVNAQRFDDAFYRLWCFCKIFGCDKGREDDVTGQLDWLRGGLLAHQQDCAATVNINLEFDMGGVLLNAPDHFAMGNAGGLTASQLYDITEIWNCLASLLAGYHGRTEQARHYGIYNDLAVPTKDIDGEVAVLEEWMSYILTLGPSVVLELAQFSEDDSDAGFKFARLNGWTDWTLSTSGNSRCTFFREPVARLYEERIAMTAMSGSRSEAREKKEMGRKRVASLAAEIKLARTSSTYQRLPLIDMASERPMSVLGRRDSAVPSCPPLLTSSPPTHYGMWSSRRVSPVIEDRVEGYNRLSLLSLEGVAEDTGERAVAKIVAMGFSVSQAKEALKLTDMGNGLRVDRAVDLLLRQYQ